MLLRDLLRLTRYRNLDDIVDSTQANARPFLFRLLETILDLVEPGFTLSSLLILSFLRSYECDLFHAHGCDCSLDTVLRSHMLLLVFQVDLSCAVAQVFI
jgi:hypothetical protein